MSRVATAVQCRLTRARLAAGTQPGDHLASCLGCQAEEARYRALSRQLASLRSITTDAPPSLQASVMARIASTSQEPAARSGLNKALVAGVSSVTAAAVAGAVMFAARRRARVA